MKRQAYASAKSNDLKLYPKADTVVAHLVLLQRTYFIVKQSKIWNKETYLAILHLL
jgi:hypothetical protein